MQQYADLKIDIDAELAKYRELVNEIRPCITDTVHFMNQSIRMGKKILIEGANATMLDIDFGIKLRHQTVYIIKCLLFIRYLPIRDIIQLHRWWSLYWFGYSASLHW